MSITPPASSTSPASQAPALAPLSQAEIDRRAALVRDVFVSQMPDRLVIVAADCNLDGARSPCSVMFRLPPAFVYDLKDRLGEFCRQTPTPTRLSMTVPLPSFGERLTEQPTLVVDGRHLRKLTAAEITLKPNLRRPIPDLDVLCWDDWSFHVSGVFTQGDQSQQICTLDSSARPVVELDRTEGTNMSRICIESPAGVLLSSSIGFGLQPQVKLALSSHLLATAAFGTDDDWADFCARDWGIPGDGKDLAGLNLDSKNWRWPLQVFREALNRAFHHDDGFELLPTYPGEATRMTSDLPAACRTGDQIRTRLLAVSPFFAASMQWVDPTLGLVAVPDGRFDAVVTRLANDWLYDSPIAERALAPDTRGFARIEEIVKDGVVKPGLRSELVEKITAARRAVEIRSSIAETAATTSLAQPTSSSAASRARL